MDITVRRQQRSNMVFRLTSDGAAVLIPAHMDPDGDAVQRFIADALTRLPEPEADVEPLALSQLLQLVAAWCDKLDVAVTRVQVREMRNKWGSISTAGTLTLADGILRLPVDLAEYVVVHELLHLKFPDHRQGWQVSMGMYLPDWRERERRLQGYVVADEQIASSIEQDCCFRCRD